MDKHVFLMYISSVRKSLTMEYGQIEGLNKKVSRLAQGTVMFRPEDKEQNFKLLDAISELGCNTFDTAHIYGSGQSERALGQWVNKQGLRDKVVVIDKGCHSNEDRKRVTPFDITSDLNDSLARLQFDYIDIYMLHRDDPAVPVGPIVEALNEHREAGRIHILGASNWTHNRIVEANNYALAHKLEPFRASSPNFSLAVQVKSPWGDDCISISGPDNAEAREWYKKRNFPLFTWSSLAGGFFSGRLTRKNFETIKDTLNPTSVHAYCYEENFQRLDRVEILAKEKGLKVPQIAMAYVMSQPLNIFALIGCYTGAEFQECLDAASLKLTAKELAWLDLRDR